MDLTWGDGEMFLFIVEWTLICSATDNSLLIPATSQLSYFSTTVRSVRVFKSASGTTDLFRVFSSRLSNMYDT